MTMMTILPVAAAKGEKPFPNVKFKVFSKFVEDNFSSTITLSTVLMILFTVTENVDLLNLHFRQRSGEGSGENSTAATGWIRCLGHALNVRLQETGSHMLKRSDLQSDASEEKFSIAIGLKVDSMARMLGLCPLNKDEKFRHKLKPVSYKAIEPLHLICPGAATCQTHSCKGRALYQWSRQRDIPLVHLIKDFTAFDDVPVLSGHCKECKTKYYADHERAPMDDGQQHERVYLNSARYVKIGHNLWVDHSFTSAVLSAMYNFHGSAAAYADFWNDAMNNSFKETANVTRCQIWQAFMQESICLVASSSNIDLTMQDGLAIDEVARESFYILGQNGMIKEADQHACDECTHKYRRSADIVTTIDESATVGMEEVAPQSNNNSEQRTEGVEVANPQINQGTVKMVVMDGIVIGHSYCAYDNCTADLQNARGGVYCNLHENLYGGLCHAADCSIVKVQGTQACEQHQNLWRRHLTYHRKQTLGGYRRAIRRPDDTLPWVPQVAHTTTTQPHDEEEGSGQRRKDQFTPPRFYCVETICAPCGVVIAWAKFAKSESPTNIMQFLARVYPTQQSRPSFVCIDKACLILRKCT